MDRVKTNYFSGSRVGAEEREENSRRKNDGKIKLSKHKPS